MDVLISLNQGKTFISGAHTITASACVSVNRLDIQCCFCFFTCNIFMAGKKKAVLLHFYHTHLSLSAVVTCGYTSCYFYVFVWCKM